MNKINDGKEVLSFCTTATIRPEIIERTYRSFTSNLHNLNFKNTRLYLNIDPLPADRFEQRSLIVDIAKQYFGIVVPNLPHEPNFTNAVNWCWSEAETEYLFLLEDDWILKKAIDIYDVIHPYIDNDKLYQVILRAYPYDYRKLVLSPSIIHKRMFREIAGRLNPKKNPEVQLREKFGTVDLRNTVNRIFCMPDQEIIVKDIGRAWLDESTYCHPGKKDNFTSWQNKDNYALFNKLTKIVRKWTNQIG